MFEKLIKFFYEEHGKPKLFPASCDRVRASLLIIRGAEEEFKLTKSTERFVLRRSHTEDGRRARFLFSAHRVSVPRSLDIKPQLKQLEDLCSQEEEIKTERNQDLVKSAPGLSSPLSQSTSTVESVRPFLKELAPPTEEVTSAETHEINESNEKKEEIKISPKNCDQKRLSKSMVETKVATSPIEIKQASTTDQVPSATDATKAVQEEKLMQLKAKLRQLEADIQEQKKRRQTASASNTNN